jgi:hypothetical protein
LTGDSSITTAGGTGDNIALGQTVNGAHDLSLNAGALGTITTSAVIGGSMPLGDFSATGSAVTFGRSVSAGSIFARSTTGNLTLNTAGTVLTGSGAGDAIQLVAAGASSRFVNNAGAGALNASHAGGRFLVWSQNPANDTRGGLAYAFKQYNATYGATAVADADPGHDGFLYTLAPTITPTLTGTVDKIYDGTTAAALTTANFSASGAIDGDTVSLSGSGSYDDRNVGVAKAVTATGIAASAVNGAATVYGYAVSPGTASAAIGTITAAPLTVTAQADTRIYDGTTASAATPVVSGTTYDPIGTAATQSYDNRNAGTGKTLTASGLLMNDGNGGANYAISYVSDSSGVIVPAPLILGAVGDSKVYDGTTVSDGTPGTSGLVSSDTVSGLSQRFLSRNVLGLNGSTLAVEAGYTVNDGNGGANYSVTTHTASGTIAAAALTIAADDASRLMGTPNPPFSATYTGLIAGETPASLNGVLAFSTPATLGSPAGDYAITPYGQTSDNYLITYVDGVLEVMMPPGGISPGYDPQAVAAAYSAPRFQLGALPAVRYVTEAGDPAENAPGNRIRIVSGGLRFAR